MKRLYNPIAIYNYNKGKYFIALDDGKVVFFKYEDNEISNDYSKDELEVFYAVYNSLKVDKDNAINLGYRKYNCKCFETFYDENKELYFWYEIINGKRANVSKEDLEMLNYRYNSQCLKFAEDNEGFGTGHEDEDPYDAESYATFIRDDSKIDMEAPEIYDWAADRRLKWAELCSKVKTFQRAITVSQKVIAVVVAIGVNLLVFSEKTLDSDTSSRIREVFGGTSSSDSIEQEENSGKAYDYTAFSDAIGKNLNLLTAEKILLAKFEPYFDEVGPYMDQDLVTKRLANLKIVYTPDTCEAPDVAGEYDTTKNVITMYSTDSFENCNKSALIHEFFHVTQKGYSNRLAMELSDEAVTREQIRNLVEDGVLDGNEYKNEYDVPEYGVGYDKCMKVYYLLASLLDEETVKKYQAIPSDTVLTDALVKIENNSDKKTKRTSSKYEMRQNALELLDYIDELRSVPDKNGYRTIEYSDAKYKMIFDQLNFYYKAKWGRSIYQCLTENIVEYDKTEGAISRTTPHGRALWNVMDNALMENVEGIDEKNKVPMGEYRYVLPKSYFSDRHPNPTVYFNTYQKSSDASSQGFFVGIEITPEMEEEYLRQYTTAQHEIIQEMHTESSKDTTDNVGGMSSMDRD